MAFARTSVSLKMVWGHVRCEMDAVAHIQTKLLALDDVAKLSFEDVEELLALVAVRLFYRLTGLTISIGSNTRSVERPDSRTYVRRAAVIAISCGSSWR